MNAPSVHMRSISGIPDQSDIMMHCLPCVLRLQHPQTVRRWKAFSSAL